MKFYFEVKLEKKFEGAWIAYGVNRGIAKTMSEAIEKAIERGCKDDEADSGMFRAVSATMVGPVEF